MTPPRWVDEHGEDSDDARPSERGLPPRTPGFAETLPWDRRGVAAGRGRHLIGLPERDSGIHELVEYRGVKHLPFDRFQDERIDRPHRNPELVRADAGAA